MKKIVNIAIFLSTINSFSQTKKVFGSLRDTTLHEKISFASACIGDSCYTTNSEGEFVIYIANYQSSKSYSLNLYSVSHDKKTVLISDSTKFPLDIILFNYSYALYKKRKDVRVYDKNVKLIKYQHQECGEISVGKTIPAPKVISKKITDKGIDIVIKYYEDYSLKILPVAKLHKDTLFVYMNEENVRGYTYNGSKSCYITKFSIRGIKNNSFILNFEDQIIKRNK